MSEARITQLTARLAARLFASESAVFGQVGGDGFAAPVSRFLPDEERLLYGLRYSTVPVDQTWPDVDDVKAVLELDLDDDTHDAAIGEYLTAAQELVTRKVEGGLGFA